jgi:hypothetical protein
VTHDVKLESEQLARHLLGMDLSSVTDIASHASALLVVLQELVDFWSHIAEETDDFVSTEPVLGGFYADDMIGYKLCERLAGLFAGSRTTFQDVPYPLVEQLTENLLVYYRLSFSLNGPGDIQKRALEAMYSLASFSPDARRCIQQDLVFSGYGMTIAAQLEPVPYTPEYGLLGLLSSVPRETYE